MVFRYRVDYPLSLLSTFWEDELEGDGLRLEELELEELEVLMEMNDEHELEEEELLEEEEELEDELLQISTSLQTSISLHFLFPLFWSSFNLNIH